LLERAFELMNESGDTEHQAKAYTAYGNLLKLQGKYHESMTVFENLIQAGTSTGEIAAGMLGVASCYGGIGDKPNAIIAYQRAIDYCIINGELTYADWGKNALASL
jgi:tetratricopeptide (TPR) repeat protein